MKWYHYAIILLILTSGSAAVYTMTRGIRNKNPGNIKYNPANNWKGQVGADDAGFVKFSDSKYGIRAMGKLLDTYRAGGIISIRDIIERWAPSTENKTEKYIKFVVRHMDVATYHFQPARGEGDYPSLVKAIITYENGFNPYSDEEINAGLNA
jgi:hypothetical protein